MLASLLVNCEMSSLPNVSAGNLELLKFILAHGPDLEAVNEVQQTPLFIAAAYQDCDAIRELLDRGANRFHVTSARPSTHTELLNLVMGEEPFDNAPLQLATQTLSDGRTLLHLACSCGNGTAVAWLLDRVAQGVCNTNARTADGDTLLIKISPDDNPASVYCAVH